MVSQVKRSTRHFLHTIIIRLHDSGQLLTSITDHYDIYQWF